MPEHLLGDCGFKRSVLLANAATSVFSRVQLIVEPGEIVHNSVKPIRDVEASWGDVALVRVATIKGALPLS